MSLTLPVDGQFDWGDELNTAVQQAETDAQTALTTGSQHAENIPADPHGDRAFAQGLVNPLINGLNLPNGLVQLNSKGTIPLSLITYPASSPNIIIEEIGGTFINVFDVVATYGAPRNLGIDCHPYIQAALDDCAVAGGGEVWIPDGVYSLGNYLNVGANTWIHCSGGVIMERIVSATTPLYLLTNCQFGTNFSPGGFNIRVTGGRWDAVGNGLTAGCSPFFFIQAENIIIEEIIFNNIFNYPCIEFNGCSVARAERCHFTGTGSNFTIPTCPAIRLNSSSYSTTPTGLANSLYNNSVCSSVSLSHCGVGPTTYTHNAYGAVAGSDLVASGFTHGPVTAIGCYSNNTLPANLLTSNWSQYAEAGNTFA